MPIRKNAIYALRLCQVLSGRQEPMSLVELGKAIDLTPVGVQQALVPLLCERVVLSRRGLRGGCMLRKTNVNVTEVVAAIRRKIGSYVTETLRRMKLDDI